RPGAHRGLTEGQRAPRPPGARDGGGPTDSADRSRGPNGVGFVHPGRPHEGIVTEGSDTEHGAPHSDETDKDSVQEALDGATEQGELRLRRTATSLLATGAIAGIDVGIGVLA